MNEVFIVSGNSPEGVREELRSEELFRTLFQVGPNGVDFKITNPFLCFLLFLFVN